MIDYRTFASESARSWPSLDPKEPREAAKAWPPAGHLFLYFWVSADPHDRRGGGKGESTTLGKVT